MKSRPLPLVAAAWLLAGVANAAVPIPAATEKPTIVLVHGAFADASSWNGVIRILEKDGYTVIAAANPLRSVHGDAQEIAGLLGTIRGPVVLVGHSYGGAVISGAANNQTQVKALVFVSAFAPDAGESAAGLSAKFPGSTLGAAIGAPVPLAPSGNDLYIQPAKFRAQFAADVTETRAQLMAAAQRPVTDIALGEPAGEPAWKSIPSWFVYGDRDLNIPPQALAFMAKRAHSRETVVVKGASHVVMLSHPASVAKLIETAAAAS